MLYSYFFQIITYSTAPYFTRITYMTGAQREIEPLFNFLYPFSPPVWAALAASVAAVGAAAWGFSAVYGKMEEEGEEECPRVDFKTQ